MIVNQKPDGGKSSGTVSARVSVSLALLGGLLLVSVAPSQSPVPEREPLKRLSAQEWRKQFPFVPLGDRLDYEAKRAPGPQPVLTPEARKRLEETDRLGIGPWGNLRLEALKKLHSQEADQFIKRDGFGLGRMPRPSTRHLNLPVGPTIPQGKVSYDVLTLQDDPLATLPKAGPGLVGPARLPSLESLLQLHGLGRGNFLNPGSFGYVKDRNHISGFEPHQFRSDPSAYILKQAAKEKAGQEHWVMRRLELVSLLKFEQPAVYVSDHLPRMQDLKNTPRRALSAFEEKALRRLQAGEDVVTEATTNRIRMLGALRAGKQCLNCHQAPFGELLGSFSYDLVRDPPLRLR